MTKRSYCPHCNFPSDTCLCAHVSRMSCDCEVTILQHPNEVNHAKNTVRLVRLVMPKTRVLIGESSTDFQVLSNDVKAHPNDYALLFPSDKSRVWRAEGTDARLPHLLFIDATWKKAYKMWMLNDWLQLVPQMHLDINENSAQYRIRKARKPGQLSTLEAISCVLSVRYDTTPLDNVFEAFQKQFQSFQNDSSI